MNNKTRFVRARAFSTIFQPEYIEGKNGPLDMILLDLSLLEKGMLIKMIGWNI